MRLSALVFLLTGLALVSAAATTTVAPAAGSVQYPFFYTVSYDSMLGLYHTNYPSTPISSVKITGLRNNERIVDIDIRPLTNELYAVGKSFSGTNGSLYVIYPITGKARFVKAISGCDLPAGDLFAQGNPSFGIDFDPVSDKLRIATQTTQNFVVDPTSGACTAQTNFYFAGGDVGRGSAPIRSVGYSNSVAGTSDSRMYFFDTVHYGYVITPNQGNCFVINGNVVVDGPFDIYTSSDGTNVGLLLSATYNSTAGEFDEYKQALYLVGLENGVLTKLAKFDKKSAPITGFATIPTKYVPMP